MNRSKLFHGGGFYPGSEPWQRGRFCTTCDLSEPSLPTQRCRVLCQPGCQAQAGTWSSNAPQSHGMKDTVVLFLLVCQNVILQESLRGIQDCERPHWRCGKGDVFRWTSLEKCRVNYQRYMCPLSLSLGCLESFTQIHLIFCCPLEFDF